MSLSEYTNYTGGAYGIDTYGCLIGIEHGFNNHVHFRPYDNTKMSKKLRDRKIPALVLTEKQVKHGRDNINRLLGTNHRDNIAGNLQGRNYFQVMYSDAIYCFSKIKNDNTISGGTNTAFQLGIKLMKHVYVYNLVTYKWHYYNHNDKKLLAMPELAKVTLKPKYAIVGTRDVEDYHIKDKKTGLWGSRPQYLGKESEEKVKQVIGELYLNTLEEINA